MHFQRILCLMLAVLFQVIHVTRADVSLCQIFSDNAVLQRNMPVHVWGWGTPGESVTVTFANQTQKATADTMGRWSVTLAPMKENATGQLLRASDARNSAQCRNVVVGEVWMIIGDHKLNHRFLKSGNTGVSGDQLRLAFVMHPGNLSYGADQLSVSHWLSDGVPQGIPVSIGKQLQEALKVPVGLVVITRTGVITPFI